MLDNQRHGYYACYWDASGKLQAKMMYNSVISDGKVVWDAEEQRYGCEFNPPSGAKNFVATIIGGGGGGAGAASTSSYEYKHFTTPIDKLETWTTSEAGIYNFLLVGGGGAGGKGRALSSYYRWYVNGGAGTPGEITSTSNIILNKGEKIQYSIGKGADSLTLYDNGEFRYPSSESRIVIGNYENPELTLRAFGGSTGVSQHLTTISTCNLLEARFSGSGYLVLDLMGFNPSDQYITYHFGCGAGDIKIRTEQKFHDLYYYETPAEYMAYSKKVYPVKGSSPNEASRVGGKDKDKYTVVVQQPVLASAGGAMSQSLHKYYNNPNLPAYNNKFGLVFNIPVKASQPTSDSYLNQLCEENSFIYHDCSNPSSGCYQTFSKPANALVLGHSNGYCFDFQNNFGAGGSGSGTKKIEGHRIHSMSVPGKDGFVGISWKPLYAGLGGEAGKVMQIPYAELPQKTWLCPGRGGAGGIASPNISASSFLDRKRNKTEGQSGQTSYIKNGTPVLGGTGAPQIDVRNDSTYSSEKTTINSGSAIINKFLAGGNGKLSDVLTSKKETVGGLGGYSGTNNSANGSSLKGVIFQNGAAIGSFNRIYGAGAGGGGGSAYAGVVGTNVQTYGHGGDGASGLVFIQW